MVVDAEVRVYLFGPPPEWPWAAALDAYAHGVLRLPRGPWRGVLVESSVSRRRRGVVASPWRAWRRLLARVEEAAARLEAGEIAVVAPWVPGSPDYALSAAREPMARRACRDYRCLIPVYGGGVNGRSWVARLADEAARLDAGLYAPVRDYCRHAEGPRALGSVSCQLAAAHAALEAARSRGIREVYVRNPTLDARLLAALRAATGIVLEAAWRHSKAVARRGGGTRGLAALLAEAGIAVAGVEAHA